MQMKTSHNAIEPLELCTICEIHINMPSAELESLASIQEPTQKWVALCYVVLETLALRRQCANFCSTYYSMKRGKTSA